MYVRQEFESAFKRLLRRPISAVGAVLTLTLGIATSVSMFSVLHGVVLSALPYPHGDRIVRIYAENLEQGVARSGLTPAEAVEALAEVPGFDSTAYYTFNALTFTGNEGAPLNVSFLLVSADYFSVLGVSAAIGRTLTAEDIAENQAVVVLNHTAWLAMTGGDPNAIGRTLTFEDRSFELVGVLPDSFMHPDVTASPRAYQPLSLARLSKDARIYREARALTAIGRLAADTSPELANNALQARLAAVNNAYGLPNAGWRLRHLPLIEELVGDVRQILIALFAVTLLVLLIACANTASLLSIRLQRRRTDFAIRRALGASNTRIAMEVALELVLLAALAAFGGMVLAYLIIETLRPLAAGNLPRVDGIGLDPATLLFCVSATAASVLLSGVMPLIRTLHGAPIESLRSGGRHKIEGARRISLLPAAGIGLSTIALVTALAMAMSLVRLGQVDPGFRAADISALQLFRPVPTTDLPAFVDQASAQLRSLPGVREVAAVSAPPLPPYPPGRFMLDIEEQHELARRIRAGLRFASPGYHSLLDIPPLRGRDISELDAEGAPNVALINETLARQVFGSTDPVGQRLRALFMGTELVYEVVGVVADTRNEGLRIPATAEMVGSIYQKPPSWAMSTTFLVASTITPPNWERTLQEAIWQIDPNQAISRTFTLEQDFNQQLGDARFFATATGWFAMLALLLGAAGINALIAAIQQRRTREIGLRLALGASPKHAAALMLGNAARIIGLGLAVGTLLSVLTIGWLRNQLFGLESHAFWALFGLTALVLVATGLAAAACPAWRASRVAPMEALRHE